MENKQELKLLWKDTEWWITCQIRWYWKDWICYVEDIVNKRTEDLHDDFIDECFEKWKDKNYDEIKYEYEQNLIENGYAPRLVSEVQDWYHEFCRDRFCDEYFGCCSAKLTDEEMYEKLKKRFTL